MYLSYDDYLEYGGRISDESEYVRLAFRADRIIDRITRKRVCSESPVRECVKRLAYEIIEGADLASEATAAAGISSTSNDGVSVSYASGSQNSDSISAHAAALASVYLADEVDQDGVCLLYAGCQE